MAKEKKKVIIAMKGHPGTGKSTLAQSLASALRIPLLDKDDVRDCTSPLQRALLSATPTTASTLLNDLSYDVVFRVASTQLRLGLSIVVDSPLSRRAHLDRLVQMASSAGARVLVVECKPKNQAEWRRRLERRGAGEADGGACRHKPATWRDLERLLEGYAGCTEYDVGDVPRLVVDTTASVEVGELVSSVVEFIASHTEREVVDTVEEAVDYILRKEYNSRRSLHFRLSRIFYMELSSSRLENDGEDESVFTQIRNEDALSHQDDPQIDVDEKVVEPDKLMMLNLEEELDDKEGNVTHYEEIDGDEKVEEPQQSMKFSSEEEVLNYYRKYSKQVGFGVIRRCVKKDRNGLGNKYIVLTCICQGSNRSNNSKSSMPTAIINRTGCKARICASKCIDGMWYLGKVVLEHNHCLIRANKNVNSLVVEMGGFEKVPFGEKDCRNFINKSRELRLGKGGAQALCDYFRRMQEQDNGFYYVIDMDDDSRLRNVFWADARSRAAYESFGDAIKFDTMYLINRYDMLFAHFVGVNHHGQSMFFGAGLISNEDTDTFVWLFDSWMSFMKGRAPKAIITDQDKAIKNAIARVFPNTTQHKFCLSHIMRKFSEKFAAHAHFDGINSVLRTCLYDSQTYDEFEDNWKILLERYQLQDNAWLQELYSERTFWVPAYMKVIFLAGMNTTQGSESMNAFFDGYVYLQTTLKEFVDQFDSTLRKMVEKEAHADLDCFNRTIQCVSPFPLEKQFQDVYTNAKFKEVQEQFKKVMACNNSHLSTEGAISTYQVIETSVVTGNIIVKKTFHVYYNEDGDEVEVKCTCALFEIRGILCSHCISVLLTKKCNVTLPPRYVLDRWRKDIKRRYTSINSSYDKQIDNLTAQRREKMRKNFEEVISLTEESVEHYMEVMKNVKMLKEKFCVLRHKPSHLSHHTLVVETSSSCIDVQSNDVLTVQSNTVLTPVNVKGKGRPQIRRLVPTIKKVLKKTQVEKEHMVGRANKKKSHKRGKPLSDNNAKQIRRKNQTSKATQDITFAEGQDTILAEALPGLLSQRKYEEAFAAALRRCDVSRVSWICSQVDLRQILSEVPIPLSQGTLLNLLWYLAYDINNNPPQKLSWMTEVANAIISTDPMIAVHVRPIFGHIYAILNQIRSLPTITVVELSSIDHLIHVITDK